MYNMNLNATDRAALIDSIAHDWVAYLEHTVTTPDARIELDRDFVFRSVHAHVLPFEPTGEQRARAASDATRICTTNFVNRATKRCIGLAATLKRAGLAI